jgi:hypothetical protein
MMSREVAFTGQRDQSYRLLMDARVEGARSRAFGDVSLVG